MNNFSMICTRTYKGKIYLCRLLPNEDDELMLIGPDDLYDALCPRPITDTDDGFADGEAEALFNEFFYFVSKHDMKLSNEELLATLKDDCPDNFD